MISQLNIDSFNVDTFTIIFKVFHNFLRSSFKQFPIYCSLQYEADIELLPCFLSLQCACKYYRQNGKYLQFDWLKQRVYF